jgi:TonB family protein
MRRRILTLCLLALISSPLPAAHYPEAVWKARFTYRPFPDYPREIRRLRLIGSGIFRMHVDEQGRVTAVSILRSTGHQELDVLARRALVQWRGKPGPKWELDMPITFTLDIHQGSPEDMKHYR